MSQQLSGTTEICGYDFPFCYDADTENINIYIGNRIITVPEDMDIIFGKKLGMMTGGNILFKLSVPLTNSIMEIENGIPKYVSCFNQIRSVDFFIENFQEHSEYTEMRLQFPELDYFIPSIGRATVTKQEVVFSRLKESLYSFDVKYADTEVYVSFDTKMEGTTNVRNTAKTISEISLKFPKTANLDYLKGLYEGVRSCFVFVCNRQNIGLRSAILIGEYPRKRNKNGKIVEVVGYTQQEIIFSQKYLEPLEDEKKIKKVLNSRLFSTNLKELFQMFLEQSAEGTAIVNGSSIHPSFKYRNLIDLEQSLHITAAFEYYVRTLLPEISSNETIEFLNDMQVLVEEYIKTVTGKKKKKAKDFKKSLRPQISLEEKIMKVYEGYLNWPPLKSVLSEWFGEDISDLAKAANLWRNELAHEKREYQPDIKTIDAVRFVEHVNYCIILRYAGYADEQIKEIVSDVLIR